VHLEEQIPPRFDEDPGPGALSLLQPADDPIESGEIGHVGRH
jgi:hypothetical protein